MGLRVKGCLGGVGRGCNEVMYSSEDGKQYARGLKKFARILPEMDF